MEQSRVKSDVLELSRALFREITIINSEQLVLVPCHPLFAVHNSAAPAFNVLRTQSKHPRT